MEDTLTLKPHKFGAHFYARKNRQQATKYNESRVNAVK